MSDRDPSPLSVRLPWGFFGMLALVLAVEGYTSRHEFDLFLKLDHWTWRQIGRLADSDTAGRSIVCLGDSMVQVGIAPPVLEKQTGRKTCNLAIGGGQAVSSYFLLRRTLEAGTVPEAILVDFFPRLLQASPLEIAEPWAWLTRLPECAGLAWTAGDLDFFARTTLTKLMPTIRSRDGIRDNLRAAVGGEDAVDRHVVPPSLLRNSRLNRGGVLCPAKPGRAEDLADWVRRYFPPHWTCHPVNEEYLRRFLSLAESKGIPVFWLLPPLDPDLQRRCEANGYDERHTSFVSTIRSGYRNVHVIDARHSAYDKAIFFDPHHLAREGAGIFTAAVAGAVRRALEHGPAGSAWVDIPRYRAAPIDVPLEDIEQSRLAVKDSRAIPRR